MWQAKLDGAVVEKFHSFVGERKSKKKKQTKNSELKSLDAVLNKIYQYM